MTTIVGRRALDSRDRDPSAPHRHVDVVLVLCVLALSAIGLLMIFSATRGPGAEPNIHFVTRQFLFASLGVAVMIVVAAIDYRQIRDWSPHLYGLAILALALVVSPLGQERKGAQAWFELAGFQVQPSEPAKLVLILALSAFLTARNSVLDLRRSTVALVIAGMPAGLILLQPDLGTVLVFVVITIGLLVAGGMRVVHLVALVLAGLVVFGVVLNSDVLADYQRDRLTSFLDLDSDPQGASYNLRQSQIAIGSGGLEGKGLFAGPQTQGGFVPEQQTDFIFTAVGEELGLVGSVAVLALFAVVCLRVLRAAQMAGDRTGGLACCGVLVMLAFQVFQNVGMSMGIMPITGIPLPFLSYGGSSMITSFASIGLVLNVTSRRFL